ncbi:MAG: internal scaffolding protein [Microvirus sp.]|nr:MAG: internal scaffolding protein [Microvirus sp.]
MIPFVRQPYNYDVDQASEDSGLSGFDAGFTQQSFKDECDINEIVRRFGLTGQLPEDLRVPVSGDFTGVSDFATAMLAVRQAQEGFNALPGALRARFSNDPQRLLDFMEDGSNLEEAVKLGLVQRPAEVARDGFPASAGAPVVPAPVKAP